MQYELKCLMDAELRRAATLFGEINHSDHESYAVLKEEVEEAEEAMRGVAPALDDFWKYVKMNINKMSAADQTLVQGYKRGNLCSMQRAALKTAEELIQVAAMCEKAIKTLGNGEGVGNA